MVRYTITVEDETISDHIRYVNNGQENNLAKEHEFLVEGLLPGKTNFIVMELVDSTGNTRETKNYQYTTAGSPSGIDVYKRQVTLDKEINGFDLTEWIQG